MSIFGNILHKIFPKKGEGGILGNVGGNKDSGGGSIFGSPAQAQETTTVGGTGTTGDTATADRVDVVAVLDNMAQQKGMTDLNYKTSIVDLLKLLDLDSSLSARKDLATELGVHAGDDGSAEQNIALQKAVMAKLAENGGIVPDSLRD